VGAVWDQLLAAGRPALLEAVVDPNVPPMPPHISLEQAKNFTRAALRDAEAHGCLKQAFKEGTAGALHKK
jgi:pyruvate dehydrogenase (quinone)